MRKPLTAAPPRLQRMILELQRNDITIAHKPGKQIPVADTLSRKPIECLDNSLSEGMDLQIRTVISSAPVNDRKMAEIKAATAQDEQLSMLRQVIRAGWPESNRRCPLAVSEYWNHLDEISETTESSSKVRRSLYHTHSELKCSHVYTQDTWGWKSVSSKQETYCSGPGCANR